MKETKGTGNGTGKGTYATLVNIGGCGNEVLIDYIRRISAQMKIEEISGNSEFAESIPLHLSAHAIDMNQGTLDYLDAALKDKTPVSYERHLIDGTDGGGSGHDPEEALKGYMKSRDEIIAKTIEPHELVIATAGFGKGTGRGILHPFAKDAAAQGKNVMSIVFLPSVAEGGIGYERYKSAREEVNRFIEDGLPVAVFYNHRALELKLPYKQALAVMNGAVSQAFVSFLLVLLENNQMDRQDLKKILKGVGFFTFGAGRIRDLSQDNLDGCNGAVAECFNHFFGELRGPVRKTAIFARGEFYGPQVRAISSGFQSRAESINREIRLEEFQKQLAALQARVQQNHKDPESGVGSIPVANANWVQVASGPDLANLYDPLPAVYEMKGEASIAALFTEPRWRLLEIDEVREAPDSDITAETFHYATAREVSAPTSVATEKPPEPVHSGLHAARRHPRLKLDFESFLNELASPEDGRDPRVAEILKSDPAASGFGVSPEQVRSSLLSAMRPLHNVHGKLGAAWMVFLLEKAKQAITLSAPFFVTISARRKGKDGLTDKKFHVTRETSIEVLREITEASKSEDVIGDCWTRRLLIEFFGEEDYRTFPEAQPESESRLARAKGFIVRSLVPLKSE